jgi:CheY-like chemotaxis protein/HPt (histidine-containing phosphotransfer) domain-containing protein
MLKLNFEYKLAEDGFKTLELLQQESFDLILLDMQMPGMNGDEVLQKIRNELPEPTRHIPVICVSATVHPVIINSLIEAGADAYLTKPYKENELIEIIEKTLSNSRLIKETNQPDQAMVINLDPLNQFAQGDVNFIIEILEYFRSNTPDILESMQQNFRTNNTELCRQLHKYRSQVSLLGLDNLTRLTLTLETALNETNSFEPYRSDFNKLLVLSQEAIVDVSRLITKLKTNLTL